MRFASEDINLCGDFILRKLSKVFTSFSRVTSI